MDSNRQVPLNQDNETQCDVESFEIRNTPKDPCVESDDGNKEDENEDCESWSKKPPIEWDKDDTKKWLLSTILKKLGGHYSDCCRSEKLVMPGEELLKLSENDFINFCGTNGSRLFELLPKQSVPTIRRDRKSTKIDAQGWKKKRVERWEMTDTKSWLLWISHELKMLFEELCIVAEKFSMPGNELLQLSLQDFIIRDPVNGEKLYESLHEQRDVIYNGSRFQQHQAPYSDDETSVDTTGSISDAESVNSISLERIKTHSKGKSGKNTMWAWEFLRNLLLDPKYCPEFIRWEDYDNKIFRLIKNKEIAQMWGERREKKGHKMNYDKFSRALRYHYKIGTLKSVSKRRLTYQFGPTATGLETDDPNFQRANNLKY
ncbi:ETS-related transcription factor Elf-5-like [Diprion similis]|uniref:ETS-related transcription factor Elf-5-like n=1 Tax=Diprion similis TaxID=362088 RepID=UPI001EF9B1FA|nr:ETS-related transcription factor Elf-5-like [Diprion similis]